MGDPALVHRSRAGPHWPFEQRAEPHWPLEQPDLAERVVVPELEGMAERPSLSAQLRDGTRPAHLAAEAALDLDVRLSDHRSYVALLRVLRSFYAPIEVALAAVTDWDELTPAIDVPARRRAMLIDEDLGRLGATLSPATQPPPDDLPVLDSLAGGLGCLYVVEGSALGGRIVARRARAALGDDLPVAFFSCSGRSDLGRDWRTLQGAINAFGQMHGDDGRRGVVSSAQQTFATFRRCLDVEAPR